MSSHLYHYDPAVSVEEGGSIVFLHERQQEALVGFVATLVWHFNAAQKLAAVAILAPAVKRQQRYKGCHLKGKIQEDSHCSVQSERLHRWHGGQGTLEDGTNTDEHSHERISHCL